MKVLVLSCAQARNYVPTEPTLAVRILDPGLNYGCHGVCQPDVPAPLKQSPFWAAELRFRMADNDPIRRELEGNYQEAQRLRQDPGTPTLELALRMREEFGEAYALHQPTQLVIHCWAGLSRSTSVAKGLCEYFQIPIDWQENGGRKFMLDHGWIGNMWMYKLIRTGRTDLASQDSPG